MPFKKLQRETKKKGALVYFINILFSFGAILTVTIGVVYYAATKETIDRIRHDEKITLELQLRTITNDFEFIISDLLFLSKQNELLHLVDNKEKCCFELIAHDYLEFSRSKRIYDQVRYLDETGMEIVRVNYNSGKPEIVDQGKLQPKGNRYYFKASFALGRDEIFVSPFDLNIENGKIEEPLKPMLRFAVPVYDNQQTKRGIIILNYLGENLIRKIRKSDESSVGEIMLVNSDGYWLVAPDSFSEWGFMIKERNDSKFSNRFSEAWRQIFSCDKCQILNQDGLFTAATVFPLTQGVKSSPGVSDASEDMRKKIEDRQYYWKIISYVSGEKLSLATRGLFEKQFLLALILFVLSAMPAWKIAQAVERRQHHKIELYHAANYDKLTNLPNRSLFLDRVIQAIKESRRYGRSFAVMFIDLDGFKKVNDTLGHDAGDQLLVETAENLRKCVREADTVARMGGDEFTVVLTSVKSVDNVKTVAKKIVDILSFPKIIKGKEVRTGASVGISFYPDNGDDADTLIKKADDAMYLVKKRGKGGFLCCQ